MTKKLQALFELPEDEIQSLSVPIPDGAGDITIDALNTLEKIDQSLPQVRGLDASDTELDELARMAVDSFKDLSDLGMQVDSRFSSEIFNVASTMLGHAITAKTAKLNKKLKMIELQLKKAHLDHKITSKVEEVESTPLGTGHALDRNELLKMLNGKTNNE